MCTTSEVCAPLFRPEPKFGKHVSMVLVQPVSLSETWHEVIESTWADNYRKYVSFVMFPLQRVKRIMYCICTTSVLETKCVKT
jgi:hypothetical protein